MPTKIKKLSFDLLFLTACVGIAYFRQYEPIFLLWLITIFFTFQKAYSKELLKHVVPFALIIFLALIVSLFEDRKTYSLIRDFTYLLKPILGLVLGYQLFNNKDRFPLKKLIYAGVFVAIGHLITIFYSTILLHIRDIHELRLYAGYFSDYEVYCFILVIFHKKFEIELSKKQVWIFGAILGLSAFLYLARTHFILFVILFFSLKGYLVLNKRSIIIGTMIIVFSGLSYTAIYMSNPQRQSKGVEAFLYKIKNAPIEPFKTKVDPDDWKDFNDNYRSYENIRTIRQMSNDGTKTVIFGKGLGSTVDLKKEVWLQSSYMRYIPVLHNGFMTVFLKAGIIGIVILLFSVRAFFTGARKDTQILRSINFLLVASGIYLIFSYWVSLGFYFVPDTKSIFIGFILAYKNELIKGLKNPNQAETSL